MNHGKTAGLIKSNATLQANEAAICRGIFCNLQPLCELINMQAAAELLNLKTSWRSGGVLAQLGGRFVKNVP